ncbi:hypothetical protein PENSPDRAFT_657318 [Peniophora sp. CONT]|nr:hypothetical protein PENSPDRAFT_657318 [Peniophora sp. CONT]
MGRTKTTKRKAVAVSTAATSVTKRTSGPDRSKQAAVMVDSHYFKVAKSVKAAVIKAAPKAVPAVTPAPLLHSSRYFQRPSPPPLSQEDQELGHILEAEKLARVHLRQDKAACDRTLACIRSKPGFALFFIEMFQHSEDLRDPHVRPILIQECLKDNLFHMVIAVILLNKTRGTVAVPMFYNLTERWGTPEALSKANWQELYDLIQRLGLGEKRTTALIELGQMWLQYPPVTAQMLRDNPEQARQQRAINAKLARKKQRFSKVQDEDMLPIAHYPFVGEYAEHSYQIYFGGDDAWKTVRARDKELVRYLKWRWAMIGVAYDEEHGVYDHARPTYIKNLIQELIKYNPYKTLDMWSAELVAEQAASSGVA